MAPVGVKQPRPAALNARLYGGSPVDLGVNQGVAAGCPWTAVSCTRLQCLVLLAEWGTCERASPAGNGWPAEWA